MKDYSSQTKDFLLGFLNYLMTYSLKRQRFIGYRLIRYSGIEPGNLFPTVLSDCVCLTHKIRSEKAVGHSFDFIDRNVLVRYL